MIFCFSWSKLLLTLASSRSHFSYNENYYLLYYKKPSNLSTSVKAINFRLKKCSPKEKYIHYKLSVKKMALNLTILTKQTRYRSFLLVRTYFTWNVLTKSDRVLLLTESPRYNYRMSIICNRIRRVNYNESDDTFLSLSIFEFSSSFSSWNLNEASASNFLWSAAASCDSNWNHTKTSMKNKMKYVRSKERYFVATNVHSDICSCIQFHQSEKTASVPFNDANNAINFKTSEETLNVHNT